MHYHDELVDREQASELAREYRDQGYVVVRSLFSRELVLAWRERAERMLGEDDPQKNPHAVFTQKAYSHEGKLRFAKVNGLLDRDTAWARELQDGAFSEVIEALLGVGARRFRDVLVVKPARTGGELSAHQDSAYWDVDPPALVSAWVALGDVDEAQSPLFVVPSTHAELVEHGIYLRGHRRVPWFVSRGLRRLVSLAGTGDNPESGGNLTLWKAKRWLLATMTRRLPFLFDFQDFRLPPEIVRERGGRSLPVRAGDVIFFHSLLWHASGANSSEITRYAEIASFMSAESRVAGQSTTAPFPEVRSAP